MENKLQELTNKIYHEGIDKAREEAEKIVADAKKEAGEIRSKAEQEASRTLEGARKEAQELQKNVLSELKLSARKAVSAVRQKITGLIIAETAGEAVKEAFRDKEFVKKIIELTIKNWNPGKEAYDLRLLLPGEDEKNLGKYFAEKQKELLNGTLEIQFDSQMNAGFKIGPKDGRFLISFTDDDFMNFFREYLRPGTIKLLYG
ncbi:MAG: hypothetical protein JXB19_04345 [Bacteroidales bacterium]|nr:hypothetical protein [Bacteroidales bacterium]